LGTFHTVARVEDVVPGSAAEIDIGGLRIALFNVDGTFRAVGALCTHRDGPLAEGVLDGTKVACPWHGAEFDVTTGACLSRPATRPVACYAVRIEGDRVLVEIP